MKIITEHPIRVVKEKKSYTIRNLVPKYASADADDDDFYGIDGKNTGQVMAFQDWLDATGIKWLKATNSAKNNGSFLKKGSGYGTYGRSTSDAYKVYGTQWEASVIGGNSPISTPSSNSNQSNMPPSATAVPPTPANIDSMKNKGFTWDKTKGAWTKLQGFYGKLDDSGILSKVGDYFGLNLGNKSPDGGAPVDSANTSSDIPVKSTGMSKGMKIGLVVGGVVILGVIIYSVTRSKGTTKS